MLVFTPERLAVMKGAPALRRRYLDRAVARSWPRYATVAAAYAGALQQRNQLLSRLRAGGRAHDALPPWEAQLAQLGAEIRRARARLVAALREPFAQHLAGSASSRSRRAALRGARARGRGGPTGRARGAPRRRHRARQHLHRPASRRARVRAGRARPAQLRLQGEQRSAVLALLTAEADLVHEVRGLRPVLLLDDVASELDLQPRAEPARAPAAPGPGAGDGDGHPPAGRGLRSRDPRPRRAGASGMMPG